ncbi:MAG: tyrosine-type recombinase/integrase [Candidatus Micrarchaeota archaeon]|nr:tyrosine-type recombinase/integrase [Candidatus Micrarchaeota archaeon]
MPKDYLHNGAYRLALELRKLEEEATEPNRSYALKYAKYLEINNRKERTVERRIHELRYFLRLIGKDAKKATKSDIENLVVYIGKSSLAEISKNRTKLTIKSFYRWLYESEVFPDLVKWIKIERSNTTKLPEELLTEDDIVKLLEGCKNQRDRAIIALLWDTGIRVGELLNLKHRDIVLNKDTASYIKVDGKTGMRRVPIVFAVPYLVNYLNVTISKGPNEALFLTKVCLPYDYKNIRKLLSQLKGRTNINKRLYPHLFRHSRASYYANSLTEQQLKFFFGWVGDSKMASTYVHLSGRDIDNAVLKANGILDNKGEPIKPKLAIKSCLKCNHSNEATAKHCVNCGSPLDISPIQQIDRAEKLESRVEMLTQAIQMLMEKLDPQTKNKILEFMEK